MRKTLLLLMALVMSAGFAFSQTTIAPSSNVPGVEVVTNGVNGGAYTGVNIFTGTDFSVWPWTSGPEAAFTPVKGGAYTMTFNFEATADMNGMRVRWITSDSYGTNQSDPLVEGMWGEGAEGPGRFTVGNADGTVAEGLSADFAGTITSGSVLTYTVHFTMDDVAAFQNIGSIGIRGGSGSNDFIVNTIVITDDATGNMLVNYDKDAPAATVLPPSSTVTGVEILSATNGDAYTGANIFTGTDFSVWPWTSGPAAAFTPVKGGAYTMTFNFEATADMNGMRVRWITSDSYGTNQSDPLVEGMWGEGAEGPGRFTVGNADSTVAEGLSADFAGTITNGSVLTYIVHFTMDDVAAFQNIGSIGIRGGSGSNDFIVNTIVITDDATGNMLVNYDKDAPATDGIPKVNSVVTNVYNTDGGIIVNGNNDIVSVYGIDGRLMKKTVAGYNTTIPLSQGIYIVKVGANAVKVIVK